MNFWYGLTFDDIADMPMASMDAYLERLPARFAELKIVFADVISLPHMKDSHRDSSIRRWMREIEQFTPTETKPTSPAILKLIGIGVRFEQG